MFHLYHTANIKHVSGLRLPPPILEYSPKHRKRKPFSNKSSDEAQNLALAIVNFGGFTNPALPPNAPPSSFARVVESWYNVMTPQTRSKLLNLEQAPQSAKQMNPQNSEIHSEINTAPFSSETNSSDHNDTIQESADESTLIPESSSVTTSPSISHIDPSIRTSTSTSPISPHSSSSVQPKITPNLELSASSSLEYSSPSTPDSDRLKEQGEYNTPLVPPAHSNPMGVQTPLPSTQSTSSRPQISKMSRRERMLLAVREAGKADAMRTKTQQETLKHTASQPPHNAPPTQSTDTASKLDEPGRQASANWWGFLIGDDKANR